MAINFPSVARPNKEKFCELFAGTSVTIPAALRRSAIHGGGRHTCCDDDGWMTVLRILFCQPMNGVAALDKLNPA
jgi:hypothetical protein